MERIKIAPDLDEIFVEGNVMRTDFASGITYTAEGLDNYKPEYLKEVFRAAIAIAGKHWILEDYLNNFLHLEGKIS